MSNYVIRRILPLIPALWLVITLTFLMLRVAPGDITDTVFMNASPNPGQREKLREELGLDQPIYVQYVRWLGDLVTLNFGYSLQRNQPVATLIKDRLPNSMRLGALAVLIGWCIAIPIGVISAVKQDTWIDYAARSAAIFMLSVPNFFLAVLVLVVPAYLFGWSPPLNAPPFAADPLSHMEFLIAPALMLGVGLTGTLMRMTRTMMLEVLRADYIRTARAKGLTERTVILKHALKNALIPVVTILGAQLALILGGSVIIENVFGVAGMGQMMLQAVNGKDVSVVQTVNVLLATLVLTMNLLVDVSYAWLDPRIKYQ